MPPKIDPKLMPDDDIGTSIEGEGPPPETPQRKRGRPSKPGEKKLESAVSKTAIKHALFRIFSVVARFPFKSAATFTEDEFEEAATDLEFLVNKLAPVKIFFNVIAPLIGVLGLADKIQRIRDQRQKPQPESIFAPSKDGAGVHAGQ